MDRSQPRVGVRRRSAAKLPASALLALAILGFAAAGGLAAEPSIEVTGNSLATYAWTPSTAEVASGDSVAFKNATANLHGLAWESSPETPSCTGTSSVGQGNWSGSCSFAQGGIYHFYCPVHPVQMKGTVTVSGPAAPLVSTGSASAVSETGATLNGTVNPSEQATAYFFEYGPTTAYGEKTTEAAAGSGSSSVPESATVSGLSPSTTYHFRLVAKNPTGTSRGIDRTFKTTGPELPPPVEEPPAVEPPPASTESPPSPVAQAAPPGPPALAAAPEPPDTRVTLKPPARTRDRTPTLRFGTTAPGASFRCSVDAKPFKACRSPFTTSVLKPGPHRVRVAAVLAGLPDPTPAVARFRVLPPR